VASFVGVGICQEGPGPMNKRVRTQAIPSVTAGANVLGPVRVRLKRISSAVARPYPPDGMPREWWERLKRAFGTTSSAFVNASLTQLVAAARLPCSGISEVAVNASLAFIEGAKPRDEVECALVMQMACTHTAAMAVLGTLGGAHGSDRKRRRKSVSCRAAAAGLRSPGRSSAAFEERRLTAR
jgi:hypothetical protein